MIFAQSGQSRMVLAFASQLAVSLALLPSAFAQPLVPVDFSGGVWGETDEVDPRFEPPVSFKQKATPTCFAQAASFSLQFLLNSQNSDSAAMLPRLSSIDVLAQGSDLEFASSGNAFVVLHRMKNRSVWVNQDLDIDSVWAFNSEFFDGMLAQPSAAVSQVLERTLPADLKRFIPHWRSAAESFTGGDESFLKIPYLFLDLALRPEKLQLPSYNVHVFDPASPELVNALSETAGSGDRTVLSQSAFSQEEILIATIRAWFRSQGTQVVPLALEYCESKNEVTQACDGLHAINLVGVKTQCSAGGGCQDAWRIRGSWEEASEGWFKAQPLAHAILEGKSNLTYIKPCGHRASSGAREVCEPQFLGLQMGPESSKYLASYPFHYLVMARDEDLFFKQLARFEGDEDALRSVLSQKLKNGDSLGHSAVREQSTRVLKWLAEHNPTLLREMGHSVGNPAHLAVNLERLSAMKILLEKTPDLFFHQDQSGYHPADYAGIQLNGEFINEIHRMKPELLKMKNAVEFTPLKYVKVIDREFYRRLKNQLYPWYHRLGSWCLSSWFARSSS